MSVITNEMKPLISPHCSLDKRPPKFITFYLLSRSHSISYTFHTISDTNVHIMRPNFDGSFEILFERFL